MNTSHRVYYQKYYPLALKKAKTDLVSFLSKGMKYLPINAGPMVFTAITFAIVEWFISLMLFLVQNFQNEEFL